MTDRWLAAFRAETPGQRAGSGRQDRDAARPLADRRTLAELLGAALIEDLRRRAANANSPEALADEAELMVRGEALP